MMTDKCHVSPGMEIECKEAIQFEMCKSFEWDYEASIAADTNVGYCGKYQNQVECEDHVCPKLEPIKQFILALANKQIREVIQ